MSCASFPLPAHSCFSALDFARHRVYETDDVEEARELTSRILNEHQLKPSSTYTAFHSRMDHIRLGTMSLNRLSWNSPVQVDPGRLDNYYLISVPVRAKARFHIGTSSIEVSTRCAGVVSAPSRFWFEADAFFDQIVLRLEEEAVKTAWTGLTGQTAPSRIELGAALPIGGAAWHCLEPILRLLARSHTQQTMSDSSSAHVHARLQDMLLNGLLLHQSPQMGSISEVPKRDTASAALVRRTRNYLMEHLSSPLTLNAVAVAIGVSGRTLQAAFHEALGCGPMQWLRMQRLEAVRQALLRANEDTQITQTAMAFGFTHLGEFSQLYRQQFGESPSTTLKRCT